MTPPFDALGEEKQAGPPEASLLTPAGKWNVNKVALRRAAVWTGGRGRRSRMEAPSAGRASDEDRADPLSHGVRSCDLAEQMVSL